MSSDKNGARGVRLLLAENTTNTSGHQAALLWEKGNHNCESLAVMSAIILIKNNLLSPLPFSLFLIVLSQPLPSSLPPLLFSTRILRSRGYKRARTQAST